jgi:probable rRNA maturation factor
MIVNRQRRVRVPVRALDKFLTHARRALALPAQALTVCFVTNATIARWNQTYRGKIGPTDVLSFPSDAERRNQPRRSHRKHRNLSAGEKRGGSRSFSVSYLGDIAIAPAVARRNARRFGRSYLDEMRVLILHGMLHLMGYDHETDTGQMDRRERQLRRALGLA